MAHTYKNSKVDLSSTSDTVLYTVPAATTSIVKSILVSNDDGSTATTAKLYLTLDGGDGASVADAIEIGANEAINLKFKSATGVDVDNLHAVTSSGTVRCTVAAIIDDGG